MQGPIINTALNSIRFVQKNLSLILSFLVLPFLAFFLFICPLEAGNFASRKTMAAVAISTPSAQTLIKNGQKAGDLIVKTNHPLVLMINLKSAQEMGVTIPDDVKAHAKIMGDKI